MEETNSIGEFFFDEKSESLHQLSKTGFNSAQWRNLDQEIDQNLKEHFKKLESTGYTWEEAPQNLKNAAVKLASGLNITPVEAYKLLLEKITEQDLKDAIAGDK